MIFRSLEKINIEEVQIYLNYLYHVVNAANDFVVYFCHTTSNTCIILLFG